MLKTFGKEGKKEKKLAIDNEDFGEIGDAPPGDEAPRGRNKIYIEVKRIIDQKNKEYWSEDKVKMNIYWRLFKATCQEEADEVLGSKKKGESQETTLNNENLYLSQAHHYQLCDKPAASLRCINYALGRYVDK